MNTVPHEIAIGGVFLPPLLVACVFGIIATVATIKLLNHYRLAKYFFYPPLINLALVVIYTILLGTFFIKV